MVSTIDTVFELPSRPVRVLSNSAAEFVETRAAAGICRHNSGGLDASEDDETLDTALASVKFVPQLDVFMTKEEAPEISSYYQESTEMLVQFRQTLEAFTQTLQSRGIFKKLGIQPCDPAKCDIQYVLAVANAIREHKEGSKDTRSIKRFMQRCSQRASANKATISALLSMVPNDLYGSIISGGFSLILAAVEKHENNRAEIQAVLADIPRKLDGIHRLAEVSIKWPTMHRCADQIFLAIFAVLERIIDKLTMTTFQKGVSKIKGRGGDVSEAIEMLGTKVNEFKDEANTCSQITLGRTYDGVQKAQDVLGQTYRSVQEIHSHLGQGQEAIASIVGKVLTNQAQAQAGQEETENKLTNIYNTLYALFTADATFNPADGTYISSNRNIRLMPSTSDPRNLLPAPDQNRNSELAEKWFAGLGTFKPLSEAHIKDYLDGFPQLSPKEMDRMQWVINSANLSSWIPPKRSCILEAHSESAPSEVMNCLSFVTATMASMLAEKTDSVVLSCFCDKRARASFDSANSGPMAVWNSLNGQLLKAMASQKQTPYLDFLERKRLMNRSQTDPKYARALLKEMLAALPEGSVVYIMIDLFSRTNRRATDIPKGEELIQDLVKLTRRMTRLVIKLLVTGALPTCSIRKDADLNLFVPDEVDGWQNGVSLRSLDSQKKAMIEKFHVARQKKKLVSESDDGSDVGSSSGSSGSDSE
ncbi:hypothetical protein QBC39DRAFT_349778 [Podospora conica]|nr:hypothetical protein QBC39DRAFT_349778 [Schizothecium conicum]